MSQYPWVGAARPASAAAFAAAADRIGTDAATVQAVWQVESASRPFRNDRTLERRFEPHHMPGSTLGWRDSLKIPASQRETMMREAYAKRPTATLRATSWGGPQIMGFNHVATGFQTAEAMVRAFAESEQAQLDGFVALVTAWGLDAAIRAHDWQTIEDRYNGGGFGGAYAAKMEAAYRALSGRASPVVLRIGSAGAEVRRLQQLLEVEVDGNFGPETDAAVRNFQQQVRLPVDGVVGRRTWDALAEVGARPKAQDVPRDDTFDKLGKVVGGAGGIGTVVAVAPQVRDVLPPAAFDALGYGAVALLLIAGAVIAWRVLFPRRVRL